MPVRYFMVWLVCIECLSGASWFVSVCQVLHGLWVAVRYFMVCECLSGTSWFGWIVSSACQVLYGLTDLYLSACQVLHGLVELYWVPVRYFIQFNWFVFECLSGTWRFGWITGIGTGFVEGVIFGQVICWLGVSVVRVDEGRVLE